MKNNRTVIFLDIDGVLQPTWKQDRFKYDMEELQRTLAVKYNNDEYLTMDKYDLAAVYYDWDHDAVEWLRALCQKFKAEIVISSAWREHSPLTRLKDYFRLYDLDQYITDGTPQLRNAKWSRASEVAAYLEKHPEIERFIIFDDAYGSDFNALFPDQFVECGRKMEEEQYKRAKAILARKTPKPQKKQD